MITTFAPAFATIRHFLISHETRDVIYQIGTSSQGGLCHLTFPSIDRNEDITFLTDSFNHWNNTLDFLLSQHSYCPAESILHRYLACSLLLLSIYEPAGVPAQEQKTAHHPKKESGVTLIIPQIAVFA